MKLLIFCISAIVSLHSVYGKDVPVEHGDDQAATAEQATYAGQQLSSPARSFREISGLVSCGGNSYCYQGQSCCHGSCCYSGTHCCSNGGCCRQGTQCCPNGGCCNQGTTCCGGQCCSSGSMCCGSICCHQEGQCCSSNSCCPRGTYCIGNGKCRYRSGVRGLADALLANIMEEENQ